MKQFEVRLRERNQITLPKSAVRQAQLRTGDRLIVEMVDDGRGTLLVRPILNSYAGRLQGVYGDTPEDAAAYLKGENASWDEAL